MQKICRPDPTARYAVNPCLSTKINCEKQWDLKQSNSALPPARKISPEKGLPNQNLSLIMGGIVGAVAGYFIAQTNNKNPLLGTLIGGIVVAGTMKLLSPSSEKKMGADGRRSFSRQELINSLSSKYSIEELKKLDTPQLRKICCRLRWECCWDS